MIFCDRCDNMMYISVSASDEQGGDERPVLRHFCKACGKVQQDKTEQSNKAIVSTTYDDDETSYRQFMSKFIGMDPTLPHSHTIACPNEGCTRKKDEANDVIYIKYDADRMKFLYHCVFCKTFWKLGGGVGKPEIQTDERDENENGQ